VYRGAGSIGFAGQARAVFLAAPTHEDRELRVFARVKGNLSPPPPSLAYRIVEAKVGNTNNPITTQKIEWQAGTVDITADQLVSEPVTRPERERRGPKPEKQEAAQAFLRELLSDGFEHKSEDILKEGKGQGFSKGTVWLAAESLNVHRRKKGFQGDWLWSLPK